jgi:hypothetical protein
MADERQFTFEISLSVLNHLGRNLYRSSITVLGEAVSNSWDADAENVWIYIDRDENYLVIKDDGIAMTADDFQNKFLKIGYTKRKYGETKSAKGRPYIGRKGIGKLALLSCADKISVISKKENGEYVGGTIDNSGLDRAINEDLTPDKYQLGAYEFKNFEQYADNHEQGTIIYFKQTKENIRNTIPYLKKLIALYFRFSLVDRSFNIFVNNKPVTLEDLKDLSEATEFLWNINSLMDPYLDTLSKLASEPINLKHGLNVNGFIASVEKPRYLKIAGTAEKTGIDLFVNGRLREKNILKHMPDFSTRYIASYLYGQIHFNDLDSDENDRFTTSREAIAPGDQKYEELLKVFKEELLERISDEWDKLRLARGKDGDDENPRKTPKERRALSLYILSAKDYSPSSDSHVNNWIKDLKPDAEFNIPAYVDCFLSENLIRKYIKEKQIPATRPAETEIRTWREREQRRKSEANINFDIRQYNDDFSYLGMDFLAKVVEGNSSHQNTASLVRDAIDFKPMRNAVGHTAVLTETAKNKLRIVFENIKGRIKTLIFGS